MKIQITLLLLFSACYSVQLVDNADAQKRLNAETLDKLDNTRRKLSLLQSSMNDSLGDLPSEDAVNPDTFSMPAGLEQNAQMGDLNDQMSTLAQTGNATDPSNLMDMSGQNDIDEMGPTVNQMNAGEDNGDELPNLTLQQIQQIEAYEKKHAKRRGLKARKGKRKLMGTGGMIATAAGAGAVAFLGTKMWESMKLKKALEEASTKEKEFRMKDAAMTAHYRNLNTKMTSLESHVEELSSTLSSMLTDLDVWTQSHVNMLAS